MALKLYNESDIQDIADAIRGKNGSSDTYTVSEMADAIDGIPTGGGGSIDYADQDQPIAVINSDITTFKRENGRYAFYDRAGISEINLPKLTMFGAGAFSHAISAEHIYVPKANIPEYTNTAFEYCTSLKKLALPAVTGNVYNAFFQECSNLEAVDLAISGFQQGDHFKNCAKLSVVVLRHSSVVTLSGTGTFSNSPFASGKSGGTLYVPSSLISSYQSATNWSTILGYTNNQIKSIESTHTDPNAPIDLTLYYADGTTIPTS